MESSLPFLSRLFFAWVCYFRVLFDGAFAFKVRALADGRALPALPEAEAKDEKALPPKEEKAEKPPAKRAPEKKEPDLAPALQLLSLFQREGRFVDFLEEDVASFADADIGAAARVVHAGCRKALREHVKLVPVREEEEGKKVTLAEGFDPQAVKLTGDVQGKGPHTGTLRHRGWRAEKIELPAAVEGHDARVIAQAEVEL